MKYLFVLNPISGSKNRAEKIVNLINNIFKTTEHYFEFAYTTGPGDATKIARQSVEEEFDIVVAAGGDGTINEVASGLVNSSTALGIIPLGSGNGYARSLNIPLHINQSIDLLLNPVIQKVDVGKAGNKYFFGVFGLGFDANIGKRFQDFGIRGPLPYFFIGIHEFIKFKPNRYKIIFDDKIIETEPIVLAIANTCQYGNGAIIAPEADPADGWLDICVIRNVSFFKALKLIIKMFQGSITESPDYNHYRSKSIEIISENPEIVFHTDGEPDSTRKNIKIELMEKYLNVCTKNE